MHQIQSNFCKYATYLTFAEIVSIIENLFLQVPLVRSMMPIRKGELRQILPLWLAILHNPSAFDPLFHFNNRRRNQSFFFVRIYDFYIVVFVTIRFHFRFNYFVFCDDVETSLVLFFRFSNPHFTVLHRAFRFVCDQITCHRSFWSTWTHLPLLLALLKHFHSQQFCPWFLISHRNLLSFYFCSLLACKTFYQHAFTVSD